MYNSSRFSTTLYTARSPTTFNISLVDTPGDLSSSILYHVQFAYVFLQVGFKNACGTTKLGSRDSSEILVMVLDWSV